MCALWVKALSFHALLHLDMYAHIDMRPLLSHLSMKSFLVRKKALQSQVQHLVELLKEVAPQKHSAAKRGSYKAKP